MQALLRGARQAHVWVTSSPFRRIATVPSTKPTRLSRPPIPDFHHNEDYFRFTAGRFVSNEQHELAQRYVRYDINALARRAAEAVGSKSCVNIEKYPDGMSNKVLLLTMEDGNQVIAKIPNPTAGRPHFTIASEVATMDFVRSVLKSPVPEVYAWSSRAQDNPIGAEYIIMEKLPGVPLGTKWPAMEIEDRMAVVQSIARHQKAWTSVSFKQFGSLYYPSDLDEHSPTQLHINSQGIDSIYTQFAVGPTTARDSVDYGRDNVGFDREPWNSCLDYHSAIGYREIACIQQLDHLPKSPISLCGPGTYQPTKEKKLQALQCYLTLLEYLLPCDPSIQFSSLMHGDLHAQNVFVDPERPTEVTGIIDWQTTELAPLFQHACQPCFLNHKGPVAKGSQLPEWPSDSAKLSPAERTKARDLWFDSSLCAIYKRLLHKKNPLLYRAFIIRETPSFELLLAAQQILVEGEAAYLASVMELASIWHELPGVRARGNAPFPIQFSAEEKAQIVADVEGVALAMQSMQAVREAIGDLFPDRGVVRTDLYEEAKNALQQMKEQVIATFARNESEKETWWEIWPFNDLPAKA